MLVPLTLTVVLEASVLKGQEQFTGCVLAESFPAMPTTEDRSTMLLILIGPLVTRVVLTQTVDRVAGVLNRAEVFTERVSGNVRLFCIWTTTGPDENMNGTT